MADRDLPVMDIVTQAFRYVWDERRAFVEFAMLPVVALAIIRSILFAIWPLPTGEISPGDPGVAFTPSLLMVFLLSLVLYAMFAVAWHRKRLGAQLEQSVLKDLLWDERKTRFLLRSIGVGVLSMLGALPILLLFSIMAGAIVLPGEIALLAAMIAALLTFARLAMVLPATTVDDNLSFIDSWRLCHGNSWRMVLLITMPALLTMLIELLARQVVFGLLLLFGAGQTMTGTLIGGIAVGAVSFFGIAVGVTALSAAYQHLRGGPSTNVVV